jgi:hypothetical protein
VQEGARRCKKKKNYGATVRQEDPTLASQAKKLWHRGLTLSDKISSGRDYLLLSAPMINASSRIMLKRSTPPLLPKLEFQLKNKVMYLT